MSAYFIHPNPAKEHMVCTPDGGVIECKNEAAAHRVCGLLNDAIGMGEAALLTIYRKEKQIEALCRATDRLGASERNLQARNAELRETVNFLRRSLIAESLAEDRFKTITSMQVALPGLARPR